MSITKSGQEPYCLTAERSQRARQSSGLPELCGGVCAAEVVRPGDRRYPELKAPLLRLTQGMFPIHSIFVVQVQAVEPIVAPSYRLKPGTTEAVQIAGAMQTYGVQQSAGQPQ